LLIAAATTLWYAAIIRRPAAPITLPRSP
jgi:hypothetical protein